MSESYFRHALPVGEILGDYRVLSVLGAGGFGVTYLVQHSTMGDRFAIKEYFPQSLAERENRGTVVIRTNTFEETYYKGLHGFLEEARIVRRLRGHPNVVHVNSFFEANNTAYMVMEYYAGQTLTAFRKQSGDAFDETAIRRLMIPVLDALEYIHQRDVVHRDLKPDNIFLCEDGRPILLDFGASRLAAAGGTVPMTAVLTPGFAPPEQYISEDSGETVLRQGPWTDLYALGAVLHMLACGRAPYDAMTRQMSGAQDPQPLAATRLPGFSPAYCAAVDACLRLDMKQRPQSVAQFRQIWLGGVTPVVEAPVVLPATAPAVDVAARTNGSAAPTAPPPVAAPVATVQRGAPASGAPASRPSAAPSSPPTRASWPLWTALLVLVAAIGGGTWWFLRPAPVGGSPDPQVLTDPGSLPVATSQATLLVFSDTACELRVNGQAQGVLEPGQSRTLNVLPGDQAVECIVDGDLDQTNRQTTSVLAGQQAVVELQLAELGDDVSDAEVAEVADPLAELGVVDVLPPDFAAAVSTPPGVARGPVGKQLSSSTEDAADAETWFANNGLELFYAPGPTSMAGKPSWTAGFEIPDFVPAEFDGGRLLKVINSGAQILSLYGEDFSSARILLAQNSEDGSGLYALNFSSYAAAPQRIEADRDFVDQQIVWAQQVDDVLYVSHGHSTYARSSYGKNAYITALDVNDGFAALWHSPALVSNASNFIVHQTAIISGYGFTDELDYLYVLDRADGQVLNRIKLKSGPDFLVVNEDRLYVRAYDTGYVFEMK